MSVSFLSYYLDISFLSKFIVENAAGLNHFRLVPVSSIYYSVRRFVPAQSLVNFKNYVMPDFDINHVKNIALLGHSGSSEDHSCGKHAL